MLLQPFSGRAAPQTTRAPGRLSADFSAPKIAPTLAHFRAASCLATPRL